MRHVLTSRDYFFSFNRLHFCFQTKKKAAGRAPDALPHVSMRLVLLTAVLLVLGCHVSRRGVCAAVPGYLDFDNLPDTNFSCEGKVIGGYYADVETGCQMFHVCTIGQKGEITDIKFLCLNGTVFDQETRVCERVDEVDCSKTEGFYGLNLELYGNTGATYGLEEPEEGEEDHEESQSHPSQAQSSSAPTPTSPSTPTTPKSTSPPTTPTTVISTTPPTPPSTTPAHPFTPPTTISTLSSTLHSFSQKPHTVHFSSTSSPHSVSSSFLTFPSGGDQLFETAPEGSGNHSPDLHHIPPPSSSSSSWPQVNLQSGGGSGIIHQTDSSPFHALKTTPKPVNLFGTSGHSNDHSNHQFIFSTTKAPSHFFSAKSPGGFSVTSHPPVTQFPLKNAGHLIQTNIPPDFYHEQQNRNRQSQKNSPSFLGHQSNVQIVSNPIHYQYTGRPTHQHQVFTTPSIQSTVISSTSSVSSVKTTTKHQDNHHNTQNPPANVNSFAFGINSGLSPSTFTEEKSTHNNTKQNQQHLATPPTSYDEYHERDVALDPFFKDVPRISLKQGRNKRKKRQTQENIQPSRGSRRFRNKSNSQQVNQSESYESQNIPIKQRQSLRPSTNKQNLAQTTIRFNTDSSQEPSIQTTEITRRFPSRQKSFISTQAPETSLSRDSATQESQVQQSGFNSYRSKQRQSTTIPKTRITELPLRESTSELPTTTRQPLPETSFNCDGKVVGGYYADPEADCQLFHICVLGRHGKIRDDKFLCGPGTRFDQKSRTCQTKHLVNCNLATSLYHVNLPYLFPEDNEPVPDVMFESHKVSKRATKKGAPSSRQDKDSISDSLDNPPDTDFSCEDKSQEGLYADVETECKYFHLCQKNKNGNLYLVSTFACPPGTAFNQPEGNCDSSAEIDCEIYSQPEHTFAKSKSRNKRNLLAETTNKINEKLLKYQENRHKRNVDEENTEIHDADDEIQSAEKDDQINASYEDLSEDELYDSSLEDTNTKASDSSNEGSKSQKQQRKHENRESSAGLNVENNDEINHESKEIERSEEDETDTQSLENSQNTSEEEKNDQSSDDNESKYITDSQEISYSHESDETEENNKEKESTEDAAEQQTVKVKQHSEDESLESEQDNSSIEDEKNNTSELKHDESSEDSVDEVKDSKIMSSDENTSSEEKSGEDSSYKDTQSKSRQNTKASAHSKNTVNTETNHGIRPEDVNESSFSTENGNETEEVSSIESSASESLDDKNTEDTVNEQHESPDTLKAQFHKDSVSREIKKHKEEEESTPTDNLEDESKNSFLKNETEDIFKSKVNKLLMKLNASVEDISSINVNTTNEDYYDYYNDEESLLELEELKEKILAADNSVKNKQNSSLEESSSSEIEQFREEVLGKEIPVVTTNKNQAHSDVHLRDKLKDSGKFTSQKPKISDYDSSSVTPPEYERNTTNQESDIPPTTHVPESLKTSTLDEIPITTNINTDYQTMKKQMGKPDNKEQNVRLNVSSDTIIPDFSMSTVVDQYETTTEYQEKTTDYSSDISGPLRVTEIPVFDPLSVQITEDKTKQHANEETSTIHPTPPAPTNSSVDKNTDTIVKEISASDEDTDATTELLVTTFLPDTSTDSTTTTVPSTTSNLLHPYKSRPVYRTWRTTAPPPPVSIRPNTSLRLPRPSIRRGSNKGTSNATGKPVHNPEKNKIKPQNVQSNQIFTKENSREDHEVKIKQVLNTPFKNKTVESVHKPSTEKVSSDNIPVTQQILDEVSSTVTSSPNAILYENNSTTVKLQNLEQTNYSDSTSENSDKTVSYTPLDDARTVNYNSMTPSPVLPTFSRKKFFIDRENQQVTKSGLAVASTSTTTEFQPLTESISETEAPVDESYSFTTVEAQTSQPYDQHEKTDSVPFTCAGKELHQYLPDPLDCHLFHYCSPGFHSRQLLDFRFMCDKGTAFSPVTHRCENEDASLCGNLHN